MLMDAMKCLIRIMACLLLILLPTACTGEQTQPAGPGDSTPATITITSPNFENGSAIPIKYTCQGEDSSPELQWSEPPVGTKSLALIVDDPDAPSGTWVHWVVYNIPPEVNELPEGASSGNAIQFNLPQGAIQGQTSFKRNDYGGPCPPSGSHRYYFRLYALDHVIESADLDKTGLLDAMQGYVLAMGELMGKYKKE